MPRTRSYLVPLLVMGLSVPAAPASAQIDAEDRPIVRGPLVQQLKQCKRKRVRVDGNLVAVAESCIRFLSFAPEKEGDAARDYGAIWLQTTLDSRRKWCTTKIKGDIFVPRGARLHARAPRALFAAQRRSVRTKLKVDAAGHATGRAGVVRRVFSLLPRRLRGRRAADGTVWRAAWRGSTKAKVAAASGIEVSWATADGPPAAVSSSLRYTLLKKGVC